MSSFRHKSITTKDDQNLNETTWNAIKILWCMHKSFLHLYTNFYRHYLRYTYIKNIFVNTFKF